MKRVVAIIQARMGSTRFSGKAMVPITGKPIIQYMAERVFNSDFISDVVIAIPDTERDKIIYGFCEKNEISCFMGSENDVLDRVTQAALYSDADVIIDITGDCPLLPFQHIDALTELLLASKYDYFGNALERCWPDGFDITAVTMEALLKVDELVTDPVRRSHTVWNMTQYPEIFKLGGIIAPDEEYFPKWGLTLDTKEDYKLISHLAEHFKGMEDEFGTKDIINYIKSKPYLLDINKHIQRKTPGEG